MTECWIYGLFDTEDAERKVFYVGSSQSPAQRLLEHRRGYYPVAIRIWVEKYGARRLDLLILEQCSNHERHSREAHWIAKFRKLNPELANVREMAWAL